MHVRAWGAGPLAALVLAACSASDGRAGDGFALGTGGVVGVGGGTSSAGAGGTGAVGAGTGWVDAGATDAPFNTDAACARDVYGAEQLPLDMYIMLDSTGSMGDDCNVGDPVASKWCYTINALDGFFNAPTSMGMGVALQFFNTSKTLIDCSGAYYSSPAVPLGNLPAQLGPLRTALNVEFPIATTPTEAALWGIVNYTSAVRRPDRNMVGVLVTDGHPTSCNEDAAFLAGIVGNQLSANGIKTFVIGMDGSDYQVLETIAVAGGAPPNSTYCNSWTGSPCHYYDVGNGNPQAIIDALRNIQQVSVGCRFQVPLPTAGPINTNLVNVEFTFGDGTKQQLYRVDDASQCVPFGWHYDDNVAPAEIILCGSGCDRISGDPLGLLDIVVGCAPVTPS